MDVNTVELPGELARQLHAHAEEAYPAECCGLLLGVVEGGRRIVLGVEAVANDAADDADRYIISPRDYLRIDRQVRAKGWEILGCYHSHPDRPARPSEVDRATAWPWYIYLIISVRHGQAVQSSAWMLEDPPDPSPPTFQTVELRSRE